MKDKYIYPAIFHVAEEGGYWIEFPDLPMANTQGELLEGPKIGFKLPEVLTVEEIDRIISAVDRSKTEGQRNRAILETLYSCGLRVSELVTLKLSDLYFDEGFIKVEGKGSKQRLVPISPRAINEIKLYIPDRNLIHFHSIPNNCYLFLCKPFTGHIAVFKAKIQVSLRR